MKLWHEKLAINNATSLQGKTVAVIGFGTTGISLCRFLLCEGAKVLLYDKQTKDQMEGNLSELETHMQSDVTLLSHLATHFATQDFSWLQSADLVVTSPGVALTEEVLVNASRYQVPIVSEIELASWFVNRPMIAVTGTNGKTTTASFIYQMLKESHKRCFLGGNIGRPLIEAVGKRWDYVVVEVSSFQLETTWRFHPHIALLLNITEDHLDRHNDLTNYLTIKKRIFANQEPSDWLIVNGDDPKLKEAAKETSARQLTFSLTEDGDHTVYLKNKAICVQPSTPNALPMNFPLANCSLRGKHNYANLMAMGGVARILGVDSAAVQKTINQAKAPRHRLEDIDNVSGVQYVNDSKSTTVASTVQAIASFSQPIVLIIGGRDKGADFTPLAQAIGERPIKKVIAYGELAKEITHKPLKSQPIDCVNTVGEAMTIATATAAAGDVVLFSPAASSLDQFASYHVRGLHFRDLVRAHKMGASFRKAG